MNALQEDSVLLQDSIFNNFAQQSNSNVQNILTDIQQEMVNAVSDSLQIDTIQLNNLLQFNNSLITASLCDANVQTVNAIKLKYVLQGKDITGEQDIMAIEEVASQCVFSGCPAVLEARGIMEMIGNYQYEDEEICGEQYAYRHAKPKTSLQKTNITKAADLFTAYPNPVSQKLYISYNSNSTKSEFCIVDLVGKTQQQQIVTNSKGILQMDISNLPAGVYVILLKENGEVKQNKRVCVIH
ncbi:MAG: Secretion system C-terminal sorting domain [Bacteroidota bacterium]|jgi:hypothetical protein